MGKKIAYAGIVLGFLFILTGCDWLVSILDSFNTKPKPKPTPTSQVFENTIGANGTVYTSNDGFYLEIPPGALATQTPITIEYTTEAEVGQILQNAEIKGTYMGGFKATPEHLQFSTPVTIRIPVSALPADSVPFHAVVDITAQTCQVLPGEMHYDRQNNVIELKISSFSVHSVEGVQAKPQIAAILAPGVENVTEAQVNTVSELLEGWFWNAYDELGKANTLETLSPAVSDILDWQRTVDTLGPLRTGGMLTEFLGFEPQYRARIAGIAQSIQQKAECACSGGTSPKSNMDILFQIERLCDTLGWVEFNGLVTTPSYLLSICSTLKIDPQSATTDEEKTVDLALQEVDASGAVTTVSRSNAAWESSDPSVATVAAAENGASATVTGVKEGTATIKAAETKTSGCDVQNPPKKTATATITVKKVGSLKVDSVSPATGSSDVAVTTPLVVTFNASPDPQVLGTIVINGTSLVNGGNCQIGIAGKVLTATMTDDWTYHTTYTGISVTGFKNAEGKVSNEYTDDQYTFSTVNPALAINWTWDSYYYNYNGYAASGTESYTDGKDGGKIIEPSAYMWGSGTECLAYNSTGYKYFDLSFFDSKKGSNLNGFVTWLFGTGSWVDSLDGNISINCTHYEPVNGIITGTFTADHLYWSQNDVNGTVIFYDFQGTFTVRHIATDVW